jgi:hypothetical protein
VSQTLIAALGFLGGAVAALVDGPRAVGVAAVAAALGLAPAAASVGGLPAATVVIAAGLAALLLDPLARRAAWRLMAVPGLNPLVPVIGPREALFGPRSIRAVAAGLALVAASWVSLNVLVGPAASAQGAVFAAAYVWLVGSARLLRARALEDLCVGAAAVALASAVAWILEAGPAALAEAMVPAMLAPAAAVTAGWLQGRHRRPSILRAPLPGAPSAAEGPVPVEEAAPAAEAALPLASVPALGQLPAGGPALPKPGARSGAAG